MIKIKLAKKTHPEFDAARVETLLGILEGGVTHWNAWREKNPEEYIDLRQVTLFGKELSLVGVNLSEANLSQANLARVDFRGADLSAVYATEADFQGANLDAANLRGAYLQDCNFGFAHLRKADLRLADLSGSNFMGTECDGANLRKASLKQTQIFWGSFVGAILAQAKLDDAILREATLTDADLAEASLDGVSLVGADLTRASLNGCRVFGASVWKSTLTDARQSNLVITGHGEPVITVDNLQVAQFIYLLLNDSEVRGIIDTITSKVVLIVGRFTLERKEILDLIREELRKANYSPIMFDFLRPVSRNFIETVKTLAGMARFVIADITDAKVVLEELHGIVSDFPSVPVQPLLLKGAELSSVMLDFLDYPTFLAIHQYESREGLLSTLHERVIGPAEAKAVEIRERRRKAEEMISGMRSG